MIPKPLLPPSLAVALLAFASSAALGREIEIANHSFELNQANTPLNNSDNAGIVDWTKSRAFAGVQDKAFLSTVSGAPSSWSEGEYGLVLTGGYPGSVDQATQENITPNTTYTIKVDVGGVANWQGFKTAVIIGDIYVETAAQATDKGGPSSRSLNFNFSGRGTDMVPGSFEAELSNIEATEGEWSTLTITFKTNATVQGANLLTIKLQMGHYSAGGKEDGGYLLFDNVRVTADP